MHEALINTAVADEPLGIESPAANESFSNGVPVRSRQARSVQRVWQGGLVACGIVASLTVLLAMSWPCLQGRVYVADDLGEFHLPLRNFYALQLAQGEPFDWMPELFAGFYLTGEGQVGGYHPLHLLLYRGLPLTTAFNLELLLSYPFMLLGMFLFLRRLSLSPPAAMFGATAFTFSGFSLLHFVHPNAVAVVAHLPWLLLAIEVVLTSQVRRRIAWASMAVGLLTASQLLLGYPQYAWLSLLAEVAFAAWRVLQLPERRRRAAWLAIGLALGTQTGAIQVLPTLDALAHSTRQSADTTFLNDGSLHPWNLVQLVAPYLSRTRVVGQNTHELGLYIGAVPILLCVWLFARREQWGRYRPLIRAAATFASIALLLAFGQYGGLYWLQRWLPVVGRFRFPCRAIVLFQFATAVLAAIAFALLARHEYHGHRIKVTRATWLAVLTSVVVACGASYVWAPYVALPVFVWCGPLLLAAAACLIALAERGYRVALMMLIALTAADLGTYGISYSIYGITADLSHYAAGALVPPEPTKHRIAVEHRAPDTIGSHAAPRVGDRMLLAGYHRVGGYAGLEPARQLDYTDQNVLRLAGVRWVYTDARRWVALPEPRPRAYLVTRLVSAPTMDSIEALASGRAAHLEPTIALPPGLPGTTTVVADRPGNLAFTTETNSPQLLVVNESFHQGWQVVIDGEAAEVRRVNEDFMGCIVPAGTHSVVWQFRPRSLLVGRWLSILGVGLLVCLGVVGGEFPALVKRKEKMPCDAR